MKLKPSMVSALCKEVVLRKEELEGSTINTIYFGGGTPSVLSREELHSILDTVYRHFRVETGAEITLEANPDDLSVEYLKELADLGINRLSIGVQSFFDEELIWMNRSHDAHQAEACIENARVAGLDNISIDLIFGSPPGGQSRWIDNLEKTAELEVPHLSCYGLTVEPGTALKHMIEKGQSPAPDEVAYAEQFEYAMSFLRQKGFIHYEISNYALEGYISRHNSNYWRDSHYLGIGPSAHSFSGSFRSWNIAHNPKYISLVERGDGFNNREILTIKDRYNEYVLTGMRTYWGCRINRITDLGEGFAGHFMREVKPLLSRGFIQESDGVFTLTDKGKLMANEVISDLFYV